MWPDGFSVRTLFRLVQNIRLLAKFVNYRSGEKPKKISLDFRFNSIDRAEIVVFGF